MYFKYCNKFGWNSWPNSRGGIPGTYCSKSDTEVYDAETGYIIDTSEDDCFTGSAKPIIYFYPKKDTKIKVKLGNPNNITASYPKYKNEWNIIAHPNGNITDIDTGRNLYALYWEGKNYIDFNLDDGFIVKGEDSAKFLEEKLEILGLNEKEMEEFIIYWLPILESNKYNFIRFASMEEIEKNMPLYLSKKPDTLIRVLMVFKGLDKEIKIKEQNLTKINRVGFTVVEWGGVNLDNKHSIK